MRILACLLLLVAQGAAALDNQLKNHPSPYLAMHGDDPVHWQDWSPEVLRIAAQQGKLLLVSSGYFSCHWCHVMQRESYRDTEVAGLLNRHFVAVKLDRELNPAIDAHLIDFVERTQGTAGWPLNVFLTPEGYPVVGLTYAPRDNFLDILGKLQELWAADPAQVRGLAEQAMAEIVRQRAAAEVAGAKATGEVLTRLRQEALAQANEMEGGFGDQSRFPMAPQLMALLKLQQRQPDPRLRAFLVTTLDQMANQGLRDQLAGGFFRYTVDPSWQVPHYEKMLYTQALLARVYLRAGVVLQRPDYLAVARDTLDFALEHMARPDGGFSASLSALDDAGVEGGAYLWTPEQLNAVLDGEQLALARRHWRLEGVPATDGGYLPTLGPAAGELAGERSEQQVQQLLDDARRRLLVARAKRGLPRDDKPLAGWNGLMLLALADAARVLDGPRYRQAALRLKTFLVDTLWDGERLRRTSDDRVGQAGLSDYVYVAAGLAAVGDALLANRLVEQAWRRFHDDSGWRKLEQAALPGMAVEPAISDDVLPSPSAWLIAMSLASGDPEQVARAQAARKAGEVMTGLSAFWYAGHALLGGDGSAITHADAVFQ